MSDVEYSGPIFDERAPHIIAEYTDKIERSVGDEAVDQVRLRLDAVLKHQTGRYRSSIHREVQEPGVSVNDGGMVYGPWLEGTGSRNESTRFKGYRTFRIVQQEIDSRAEEIAEHELPPYLMRLR